MISTIIQSILELIEALLPNLTSSDVVAKIVATLVSLVPVVVNEAQELAPAVRNIIAALSNTGAPTQDQLDQLAALDAQVDAAFDQAASDAAAQDAGGTS